MDGGVQALLQFEALDSWISSIWAFLTCLIIQGKFPEMAPKIVKVTAKSTSLEIPI